MIRRRRVILMLTTLGVAAALGVGCATKTVAPPPAGTAPAANSPLNAVKRFEWAMNGRSPETVSGLLTDDFLLIAASPDSAGNRTSDQLHGRSWFVAALAALDRSSTVVTCAMDAHPASFPDSRPGKDPRFHKQVRSSFRLSVVAVGESFEVTGNQLFYVTRGDSASIPAELQAQGVRPDSTRWWFDRIEDETLLGASVPARTQPAANWTLAGLLEFFYSLFVR